MTVEEIRTMLREHAVVPLWPQTGNALHLSRWSTYRAAAVGDIQTIQVGRHKRVPTAWLRKTLCLDEPSHAAQEPLEKDR
jgi:hypothetical protein